MDDHHAMAAPTWDDDQKALQRLIGGVIEFNNVTAQYYQESFNDFLHSAEKVIHPWNSRLLRETAIAP